MYMHELEERKPNTQDPNTEWPMMETSGRLTSECKRYLLDRGLSWDLAEANGWYPSTQAQDGWLRVVIPACVRAKSHVYWQARAIDQAVHRRYQSPNGPRLDAIIRVNPMKACSESVVVRESENYYPDVSPIAVITEGPMDALAAAGEGYISFAIMGMTPPQSTLDFLAKSLNGRPSLICLDNEPQAQVFGVQLCLGLASRGIRSKFISNMPAKDLAAMQPEKRGPFLEYYAKGLDNGKTAKNSGKDIRRSGGKTK